MLREEDHIVFAFPSAPVGLRPRGVCSVCCYSSPGSSLGIQACPAKQGHSACARKDGFHVPRSTEVSQRKILARDG